MHFLRYIIVLFLLIPVQSLGQGRHDVWYFGKGVGLDFNFSPPDTLMDGATDINEGTSSICDSTGKLMYYTDGRTIWDGNHDIIPNGTGLYSSGSSIQAALIVRKPGSASTFYVFTTTESGLFNPGGKSGVYYSVIQNREVVQKNQVLSTAPSERLAGFFNRSDNFYWLATVTNDDLGNSDSSQLLIYKLDQTGIQLFSSTNIPFASIRGQLVFSPNGAFIGLAAETLNWEFPLNTNGRIMLFDFNVSSGAVAFRSAITGVDRATSLAFSPDSKMVYFAGIWTYLYQVPLDSFRNDDLVSTFRYDLTSEQSYIVGGLQLGVDGRIYCNLGDDLHLSTINYPDQEGPKCQFDYNSIAYRKETDSRGVLIYSTRAGLPNAVANLIIQPRLEVNDSCAGLPVRCALKYSYADSVDWIMGDGQIFYSSPDSFHYSYKEPGYYTVKVVLHYPTHVDTFSRLIRMLPQPEPDLGNDTLLCDGQRLELQIQNDAGNILMWHDSSTLQSRTIDEAGVYSVKVANEYCAVEDTVRVLFTSCEIFADSLCWNDLTRLWVEDQMVDSVGWDFGDKIDDIHPLYEVHHSYNSPGDYTVSAKVYKSGLTLSLTKEICITSMPRDFLPPEFSGCAPLTYTPVPDSNMYQFRWSHGDTSAKTGFVTPGIYGLELERNGCKSADSILIDIRDCDCNVYVPNAFSPNNDPYNAVFQPTFTCEYSNPELIIYSRWGEKLVEGTSAWDGTYKGTPCESGSYLWILIYHDQTGRIRKDEGIVHLLR